MDTSRSSSQPAGHIAVEGHAGVLVARIDGGPHALFDPEIAKQLKELVDRADRDPDIHAVVFTGTHPDRFLSHSDVRWLQEGGTGFPPINTRTHFGSLAINWKNSIRPNSDGFLATGLVSSGTRALSSSSDLQ